MIGATGNAERGAVRGADLDDLDRDALQAYAHARGLPQDADPDQTAAWLVKLGLLARAGSAQVPTPVALLIFGRQPQLQQPQWGVCAVRVRGVTLADPIHSRADLEGPLSRLLSGVTRFIAEHTLSVAEPAAVGGDHSEYPARAVREAVVNALVHRDLRSPSRVAVQIFDDRLVVRSPGGLPTGLPPLDELSVVGGVSVPRNPLLASVARSHGLGEQLGRGLAIIRRQVRGATAGVRVVASSHEVRVELPSRMRRTESTT